MRVFARMRLLIYTRFSSGAECERGISKQQVERRCEKSRLINNIRSWETHLGPALSAERETQLCRPLCCRQMKFPWICYAAFSWYTLFNANADATFTREEELDDIERTRIQRRDLLVLPTNLHLTRRQMSLCNQNYLSIQEPFPQVLHLPLPFLPILFARVALLFYSNSIAE